MKSTVSYFPTALKFTSPIFLGVGVYFIANHHYFLGCAIILASLIILLTNYVTIIDLQAKNYEDYISVAGIKLSKERGSFQRIDRIFITKGNYAQTINTRAQSRQMDWSDYTATILFDEDTVLDLLTRNDKRELLLELKKMIASLQVDVEDRTGRDNYYIDMSKVS